MTIELYTATEDGSAGYKGTVIDMLEYYLNLEIYLQETGDEVEG